MKFKS